MPIAPPPPLKVNPFGRMGPPKPKGGGGGPPKPSGPRGIRIEHRIGVQAPAEAIWDVLYDLEGWQAWNPLYPKASGAIRIGAPLTLTLALPGQPQRVIQPTVLEWVPNEQLHWRLSLMGGLVRTVRYIEIDSLAEESCIINNGEIFGGLMGATVVKQSGRAIHRGFQAMGEALKTRAEARWQAQKG